MALQLTGFRMTVGRWMTVTAVVAILFGCDQLVKRAQFLGLARVTSSRARDYGEGRSEMCVADHWFEDEN